jgi:ParB family transcriptional regulator, chromosome partitioning protein
MSGELRQLPIELVHPNPDQPRKAFGREALEELAVSIASLGILEPIVVTEAEGGWTIVAGERRWRAAKMAGLTEVPALVREQLSAHDAFVLSMVENVLRKDMNPVEEADGYQKLLDDGLTVDELAARLGKRAAAIRSALTLRDLEPGIRDLVAKGHLSAWDGGRLATLTWNGQCRALDAINRGGLTGNDRDRVIGQVWREEHEVSMFSEAEAPEKARAIDDARQELERAVRALTRAEAALSSPDGALPDPMTIALADEALRAASAIAKVTRQAKVARMLRIRG